MKELVDELHYNVRGLDITITELKCNIVWRGGDLAPMLSELHATITSISNKL